MTTKKVIELKNSLNLEFTQIFQLCEFVLQHSTKVSLLRVTLQTLQRFLTWIPLGFIFQTGLLDALVLRFFPNENYRNEALDCITEIGSLKLDTQEYNSNFLKLMGNMVTQLQAIGISPEQNQCSLTALFLHHSEREEQFVHKLALFFTGYLKLHLTLLENHSSPVAAMALNYLLRISEVPDAEIFKIIVECWHHLTHDMYIKVKQHSNGSAGSLNLYGGANVPRFNSIYIPILHTLRIILISNMSKPEEVLVITDEDNNVVRESTKDTEQLAFY